MVFSDIDKGIRKVSEWTGGKPKQIGRPGNAYKERAKCDEFQVYMTCRGHLTSDQILKTLPRGSTAEDARKAFGRPMRQQKIMEEGGHRVDPNEPLFNLSKECKLSLVFAYTRDGELDAARKTTVSTSEKLWDATSTAARGLWKNKSTDSTNGTASQNSKS